MKPKNPADETPRNPLSNSAEASNAASSAELPPQDPEGIEMSEAEVMEPSDTSAQEASDYARSGPSAETAGLELNKTLFEEGDPTDLLHFAPYEADAPLSVESSPEEEALSFDDLSVKEEKTDHQPPVKKKIIVRREKGAGVRSLTSAIIYLVSVICVGILLGMFMIAVVNDVFAFVKDDSFYEITIEDENMSLEDLSEYLHDEGIISYPFIFRLYVGLKEDGEITLKEGTYKISPSYNYDKILGALNPAPVQEEITITFKEGMTVDDIIDLFVSKGIGTRAGFEDVIENYDFDYWFLRDVESTEDRYYRLEGYLYPDTYRFYSNSSEVAALTKMLNNFKKKVPKSYAEQCAKLGYSMDQVIIIASLIESECTWVADYEYVSAVFHNRLKSADFNGRLDSDATIQYILRHTTGQRKEKLEEADLKIESPYNTRLKDGLPPGPICNPSLSALTAALYPNEDCGYYYFVAQANGYNLYAKTYQGHLDNIKKVEKESEN